jgi:alkanesulfonate monooxygenase SsuD/methylene tetrahydromethanopterin reductase-like flavin-dependent oxidoreductase (luciferase family)
MAKYGRKEEDLKILPGVFVVVGETTAIAREKEALLQEGVDLTQALSQLSSMVEKDLRGYSVDEPAAPIVADLTVKGMQGHVQALYAAAVKDKLTLGQLARRLATGLTFAKFLGSATEIADQIEEWFEAYACDGFIIRTAYSPGMSEFSRLVMPELRRRDLVRSGYEGKTLRDHLHLARPERHAWRRKS